MKVITEQDWNDLAIHMENEVLAPMRALGLFEVEATFLRTRTEGIYCYKYHFSRMIQLDNPKLSNFNFVYSDYIHEGNIFDLWPTFAQIMKNIMEDMVNEIADNVFEEIRLPVCPD